MPEPMSPESDERRWTLVRLSNSESWCIAAGEVEARPEGMVDVASGIIIVESVPVVAAAALAAVEVENERLRGPLRAFAEWIEHGVDLSDTANLDAAEAAELVVVKRQAYVWRSGLAILASARSALTPTDKETS